MNTDFETMGEEFQDNLKKFIVKSDDLSKNSLKRVLKALAAHPLEEELISLIREDESELYDIGKDIQSIKLNMMIESLKQDAMAQEAALQRGEQSKEKEHDYTIPDHIEVPDYAKEK